MLFADKLHSGEIRDNVSPEDFASVFKVFSDAPFFEDWTPEMVLEEYHSFRVKDGFIFGYYIDGKCVAILTLRPFVPGEHPVRFASGTKTMYLSDIATLHSYRGLGIGTKLFLHGMRHTKVLGYNNMYLRTNEKSISMSYHIAQRCGFKQIWDVCQEVEFPRINPQIPSKDLRIFMVKEL